MADASRFPHIALPFALAGAAGGWLSAGLVQHSFTYTPDSSLRGMAALLAAGFGAATGVLLRRWCVGKRYSFQVDAPDPEARPPSDSWPRHVLAILFAGTAAGAALAIARQAYGAVPAAAVAAMLFTLPFLPVCAAVLAAARRAQRARVGSIVAQSDRRAVWGILAIALSLATLEALPDWAAPRDGPFYGPIPALVLLLVAAASIATVLAADLRARRLAREAMTPGLAPHDARDAGTQSEGAPRLDLGLGDDSRAFLHRGGAAYRSRDRAVALVLGDPARAIAALDRALWRGAAGLAIAGAVFAAHVAANSPAAAARYQQWRCEQGRAESCIVVAHARAAAHAWDDADDSFRETIPLFERRCDGGDGDSCMSLATLYRGKSGIGHDAALVAFFEYRAAQRGLCPPGQRLVGGVENVCVDPSDPRR